MESKNLNYCFNKEYYSDYVLRNPTSTTTVRTIAENNQYIVGHKPLLPFTVSSDPMHHAKGFLSFSNVRTVYPGLLIGTGYPHNAGVEGEFQMGCTLDYVTGLPYIPGSGVKGALRAAFQDEALIQSLLAELEIMAPVNHKKLVNSIFGEPDRPGEDIFLNAYPIYERGTALLATEAIAPHGDDPLKNPIPLPMLKIASGVRFCFRFILRDYSTENVTITTKQKLDLFRALLCFFGVGAKTNSGYGRFDFTEENQAPGAGTRSRSATVSTATESPRVQARPQEALAPDICPICKKEKKFGNLPTCLPCKFAGAK